MATTRSVLLLLSSLFAACGGSSPPASDATATTTGTAPEHTATPKAAGDDAAKAPVHDTPPASTAAAAEEKPAEEPGPSQPPREILGAPNAAFVLDYQASAMAEAAGKACDAEAADDPAKRAECMKKARASFRGDVLQLKMTDGGPSWLVVYERKGNSLPEVYKAEVEITDETKNALKLKLKGNEKGARPFFVGLKEIAVSVPNDYGIVLDDPKLGRLVYAVKIGLVGN